MTASIREDSKYLSFILRHRPDSVGLVLDTGGWVAIPELLAAVRGAGRELSRERLVEIVRTSDKRRFAIDLATDRIRANQGHSVTVDLGLTPVEPPEHLFHGTASRFMPSIRRAGLLKGERNHVHLCTDVGTASSVGARHGKPVILRVQAGEMHSSGAEFYLSANGVWLTDEVPNRFLSVLPDE